jgi:hypothetical protein
VTDHLTGLTWLQDALCTALNPPPVNPNLSLQGGRDWASALAAASTLASGQCGLTDGSVAGTWRLPNINEMESLTDLSQFDPTLPPDNHFIHAQHDYPIYWTSTITADYFPGINAIGSDLYTGKMQGDDKSALKYIWPVKGDSNTLARTGQNACWDSGGAVVACNGSGTDGDLQKGVPLPYPRFFDNGNGTTTDSLTGLIWPRNAGCFGNISSQGQAITAAKALADGACDLQDDSVAGDWRLPNRKELRSLVNYMGGWLLEFAGAPAHGWYWTSDSFPVASYTSRKWMVKSQGLAWLDDELPTYLQFPPYFMLAVRGALKVQRITFHGPATTRYGDPPLDLSLITTGGGSGNPLTFTRVSGPATLNGSILTFTGAGIVVVKAAQAGNATYYPATDTPHTFTVTGAANNVVITPADLARTYDGTPKPVTVTTTPSGLRVDISYAGSPTPPTNAGSYLVVATINDLSYQGSASDTLVIAQALCPIVLGNLSQVYDGTVKSVTATTTPAGRNLTLSYTPANPINAGNYAVVGTVSDINYYGTANGTLAVAKRTPTLSWATPAAILTGTALSDAQLNATGSIPGSFVYTPALGTVPPAGTQALSVVFTPDDSSNYFSASASVLLTVSPAPVSLYTVTFDPGGGTLVGTAVQTVASGASTSAVTAVAGVGFHFVQWTGPGGFTSTSNPLTVTGVSANQMLTATYAVNTFLVTGSAPGGNGSVSCTSPVSYGSNCVCTLTPDAGFHVFTLTDNNADRMSAVVGGSFTITGVTSNHVVSVSFARPTGILNPASGKTSPDIGDALAVLQMALNVTPSTPAAVARADIAPLGSDGRPSGDGRLDVYDVIGILRMMLGL